MSPNGIVGPPDQGSQNQGKVSIGQTLTLLNFVVIWTKNVLDICCRNFMLLENWTKVHQIP